MNRQLKTLTDKYQKQKSQNKEIAKKFESLKKQFSQTKLDKISPKLVKKNLLLHHLLEKNRVLLKNNASKNESYDSNSSSSETEEMNIRQEITKLTHTVSKQRKQIRNLFQEIEDLENLKNENKILKFDQKKIKKRLKGQKKFW